MLRMPYQKQLKVPVTFPAVLSKSRDYRAIEYLLYTLFYFFYTESVESKNVHNPYRCKADLLPMLADFYRYSYTDVKDVQMERDIIATVPQLHHYKGTKTGIENALELSKIDKTNEIKIPWFYQRETNIITVILSKDVKVYKILELLKLVVPIGTKVIIKPGYFVQSSEEIQMHSWTEYHVGPLDPKKQYYVVKNNYWHTVWDPEKQLYHTYVDEQYAMSNPELNFEEASTRIGDAEVAGNEVPGPGGQGE